jgi:hypothetical protein
MLSLHKIWPYRNMSCSTRSHYSGNKTLNNYYFFTFCWPCVSLYLSYYLTNLMYKICFIISFISRLYMFRAHVLITRRSQLHYTASGIITPIGGCLVHRLRESSLNLFISCLYMFRAHVLIIRRSKLHYTASGIIILIVVMIPEAV